MDSVRGRASAQASRLVPVGEAARCLAVSSQSIRNWCENGDLDFVATAGGHRRITVASLHRWQGFDPEPESDGEDLCVLYGRVSTTRQKRNGDLKRQTDRLTEQALGLGVCKEKLVIISEAGSGLNEDRKGYLRLIDLLLAGKVSRVIVENRDRLARYGSRLFELLCQRMNAELIIVNSKENVSNEEEMAADIMSLVTVYSARLHGKRGGDACRIELTDELRDRVLALHNMGLAQTKVLEEIRRERLSCPKTKRPFGIHALRLIYQEWNEQEKIRKVVGQQPTKSPVEEFITENCDCTSEGKCFARPFFNAYVEWAKARNIPIPTKHGLSLTVKQLSFVGGGRTGSGYQYFTGFALRNNPRAARSHLG